MAFVHDNRWEARPVAAFVVRALILAVPTALGVASGLAMGHLLPHPIDGSGTFVRWFAILGTSLLVVIGVERFMRHLAPLAMLLRLSILFPDRVPNRLTLALRAARPDRLAQLARTTQEAPSAQTQAELALALLAALSRHHPRTRGHSERVRALTMLVADEMEIEGEDREKLAWGAVLHDLGKIEVPVEVLEKRGRPDDVEWEILAAHPEAGHRLAEPLVEWLGPWGGAIEGHHERFDGTGYPAGLLRDRIPLAGRIVAVTDAFETMTAARSYKVPMSIEAARAEVARSAASHFDPVVVRSFLGVGVPRLWFAVGPAALLAQVPLLGLVARTASAPVSGISAALGASAGALPVSALVVGALFAAPLSPRSDQVGGHGPSAASVEMAASALGGSGGVGTQVPGGSNGPSGTDPPGAAAPSPSLPGGQDPDPVDPVPSAPDPTVPDGTIGLPPVALPSVTSPPLTLPLPPVPGPPVTVPPVTVPAVTLPPVVLPPITVPSILPPLASAPAD